VRAFSLSLKAVIEVFYITLLIILCFVFSTIVLIADFFFSRFLTYQTATKIALMTDFYESVLQFAVLCERDGEREGRERRET
jgi:hypothetical protein